MSKLKDLTGIKFGKLTVSGRFGTTKSVHQNKVSCRAIWLCVCDCGKAVELTSYSLTSGKSTKCKECAYAERPQSTKRKTDKERLFFLKVKRRGKEINITAEEYYDIAKNNCYYCGAEPKPFKLYTGKFSKSSELIVNGVDRVDNSGAYEANNCVAACKHCNTAKMEQTKDEFLSHIERIYEHSIKGKK